MNRDYQKIINDIVSWIQKILQDANSKGFVFGVSGGIDSALICAIAAKYFPKNHLALRMDIENCVKDIKDADNVIKHFDANCIVCDLKPTYDAFTKNLPSNQLSQMNLKSRLRMNMLYYYAQVNNYLVCGTSNACELFTGYFTKYGDSGSDFMPLANLTKQDVYECSKILNVPDEIINKAPSAGLSENQIDENDLQVKYKQIDEYLLGKKIEDDAKNRIEYLHKISEHKRNMSKTIFPIGKLI